jgi:glyoxylase-like metal-dependent hydrolase (beta-lactamase superfamily II)
MNSYKIHPIGLSKGIRDMSQWTYRWNIGVKVETVCYTWYIEGSNTKILVDTGAQEENFISPEFPMKSITSLEDGLKPFGITPADIDIVILTHLHFDHVALAHKFKKATFIVQQREIDFVKTPHPFLIMDYNYEYFKDLKFHIVDGDKEIIPGVKVLLTPGHTYGGQSVQIETQKGRVIIAGLCSQISTFTQTNSMKEKGLEVAVCGIHTDVAEAYNSALKIKQIADIIIPLHEPSFIKVDELP